MDISAYVSWVAIPVQIFVLDLMLGADNAIVIALACRGLKAEEMKRAAVLGAGGAIALRLAVILVATSLLAVPLVKAAGAIALMLIALNVVSGSRAEGPATVDESRRRSDLWTAAAVIVVADGALSLDNVIALAALAGGNFWLLAAGVAFSIPVVVYGGVILTTLAAEAPEFIAIGGALLGWIAGGMIVSDALWADWVAQNAPGLAAVAPALCAMFVYAQSRLKPQPTPDVAPAPPLRIERPAPAAPKPAEAPPAYPPWPAAGDDEPTIGQGAAATASDRAAVIGFLLLALFAGLMIFIVSYLDSLQ